MSTTPNALAEGESSPHCGDETSRRRRAALLLRASRRPGWCVDHRRRRRVLPSRSAPKFHLLAPRRRRRGRYRHRQRRHNLLDPPIRPIHHGWIRRLPVEVASQIRNDGTVATQPPIPGARERTPVTLTPPVPRSGRRGRPIDAAGTTVGTTWLGHPRRIREAGPGQRRGIMVTGTSDQRRRHQVGRAAVLLGPRRDGPGTGGGEEIAGCFGISKAGRRRPTRTSGLAPGNSGRVSSSSDTAAPVQQRQDAAQGERAHRVRRGAVDQRRLEGVPAQVAGGYGAEQRHAEAPR